MSTCLQTFTYLFSKKDVPKILYNNDHKYHRYYSDFYIPKTKTVVEVKSTYTLFYNWNVNILKFTATVKAGYNLLVIVMDNKNLVTCQYCTDLIELKMCITMLKTFE